MNTISKEQAVQLAREAGFAEMTSDRLHAVIHRFAQSTHKLGSNSGLDAAKNKVSSMPWIDGASIPSNHEMARAIESLKDNTP